MSWYGLKRFVLRNRACVSAAAVVVHACRLARCQGFLYFGEWVCMIMSLST